MSIGKNKKSVQAYVLNATSEAIIAQASATGKSASKIVGKILDERFKKEVPYPVIKGDFEYTEKGILFNENPNGKYFLNPDSQRYELTNPDDFEAVNDFGDLSKMSNQFAKNRADEGVKEGE